MSIDQDVALRVIARMRAISRWGSNHDTNDGSLHAHGLGVRVGVVLLMQARVTVGGRGIL